MLYTLPIIGALIGWFTNYIAVKMLFRPRRPIRLGFFTIQGVFPRRQEAFAAKVGELVSRELFSAEDVKAALKDSAHSRRIGRIVEDYVERALTDRLPAVIPMLVTLVSPELTRRIRNVFSEPLGELVEGVVDELSDNLHDVLDVRALVEEKVAAFSSEKLEGIVRQIMKRELRFVELIGAVLGFLIGLLQVLLISCFG